MSGLIVAREETTETMGRRMTEGGGTIEWTEAIRSPSAVDVGRRSWRGFAKEWADAAGMFDSYIRGAEGISRSRLPSERKFVRLTARYQTSSPCRVSSDIARGRIAECRFIYLDDYAKKKS